MLSYRFSLAMGFALFVAWTLSGVAHAATIEVGPNIEVSAANSQREHGEVLAAADPADPNHLIACSFVAVAPHAGLLPSHNVVYVTFDGGKHWKPTLEYSPFSADNSCVLGRHGLALFVADGGPVDAEGDFSYTHSFLYRSTDGGRTWSHPQFLADGDREYLDIDNVSTRFRNRIYYHHNRSVKTLEGTKDDGMGVYHSTDGGKTYLGPIQATISSKTVQTGPSVVLKDGTFIAAMTDAPSPKKLGEIGKRTIYVTVSKDGGWTFSNPYTVSDWVSPILSLNLLYALPSIAADTTDGPYKNRVYVTWPDTRQGHGSVFLVHSDDEGKTWSKPVIVDDIPTPGKGPNAYNAVVAVNRYGVVGVSWWDQRGIADGIGGNIRFAISTDGGESFTHSVQVSTAPSVLDPTVSSQLDGFATGGGKPKSGGGPLTALVGPDKRYAITGADTTGLAADAAGAFHPVWVSDRTGISQVWTARIAVNAHAIRNGDPSLSSLSDVTKQVSLRLTDATYDRATQTISIDAQLSNTSKKTIAGPIAFRFVQLASVLGSPQLLDSDNGQHWRGAIVTFQPAAGSTTAPGKQTATRRLTFKIEKLRRLVPDPTVPLESYVTFSGRAYAKH